MLSGEPAEISQRWLKRKKESKTLSQWKKSFYAILGVIILSGILSAQAPTGKIIGIVSDEDGNVLPGVAVEATSPKLIGKATAVTDSTGIYRLLSLTPGTYRISFSLVGFKPVVREGIVVSIEQTLKLDITLQIGALEEEVTVLGQSPLIDVKTTVRGMTLTREMFEILPRGRNFDTLATAVPGVNQEPWLGGLSVDGASGAENMYYMDGTEINQTTTGVSGQSAAFEFVDEVQIKASGYAAEYGGALGGVVNVVTRQGGNEYHGELIGYYEGSKLTGKERDILRLNPEDINVAEYVNYQDMYGKDLRHRIEGGFSLGGYILKDRLWFFGAVLPVYEPITRKVDFLSTPEKDNLEYTQKNYQYNFQAKLTAQPWGFMRTGMSFVNNFTKYKGNLPLQDGTGSAEDVYPEYGFSYPNYDIQGFVDLTFGNNGMVNLRSGRFQYGQTNQLVYSSSPRWQILGYGTNYFDGTSLEIPAEYQRPRNWMNRPVTFDVKKSQKYKNYANLDFTYYFNLGGEHAWKAGVGWIRQGEIEDNQANPEDPEVWFYWGRSCIVGGVNYGRGTYGYYQVRGNSVTGNYGGLWDVYNERWALYLQDSWTIADRFTLNVGVRAETEYLPPYANPKDIPAEFKSWRPMEFGWGDKLAPRLGFIYDVFGDASFKLFGSYGLYFDVIKTYMAAHSYSGFKWKSAYYKLDTYEWNKIGLNNCFPGELMLVYDWRHPSFESTDPDLKPVSQREVSLGAEKMLAENLSLTMRFVQKRLRYAIEDVGVLVPGKGEMYYEANPGYGYTLHVGNGTGKMDPKYPETPKAKREYYSFSFSVDKRLANNWLAGFSYTWSRLTGNYSGLGSSDEYGRVSPYVERGFDNWAMAVTRDLSYVDGVLPTDRTHFFKFYGAYTFPFRLTIGTVVNAMSGVPFTETWTVLDAYWYPFNRGYSREGTSGGDLRQMRTPFLWFANAYAEYNVRLGRYTLNFNINVDNVFDIKTATRLWATRSLYGLDVTEKQILEGNCDLSDDVGYELDQRYLKKMWFYGDTTNPAQKIGSPIAVRLGIKLIF